MLGPPDQRIVGRVAGFMGPEDEARVRLWGCGTTGVAERDGSFELPLGPKGRTEPCTLRARREGATLEHLARPDLLSHWGPPVEVGAGLVVVPLPAPSEYGAGILIGAGPDGRVHVVTGGQDGLVLRGDVLLEVDGRAVGVDMHRARSLLVTREPSTARLKLAREGDELEVVVPRMRLLPLGGVEPTP